MLFHSLVEVAENSNQTFGWMGSVEDWLVQKIGLRRLLRLDAIKAEPSFLLLTQEEDRRRFSWQVVLLIDYNHGQKSWDTLHFWGVFQFTHAQPLPLPHKQSWARVSEIFFRVSTLYRVGGRENCKKILKRMYCFMREPKNDRKLWILNYCPKDFCPWF